MKGNGPRTLFNEKSSRGGLGVKDSAIVRQRPIQIQEIAQSGGVAAADDLRRDVVASVRDPLGDAGDRQSGRGQPENSKVMR